MNTWFDYKCYEDNAGGYYLFVRDFGGPQLHGVEPVMYCFFSPDRAEIVNALGEIMINPEGTDLAEWTGWGDCEDPEAALAEIEAIVEARNGGAKLIASGDIYE